MSMERYTCRESALIISPLKSWAMRTARRVLPVAVGPSTVIISPACRPRTSSHTSSYDSNSFIASLNN